MPPLDGCDTMENFLNLLWLFIALATLLTWRGRSMHASLALGCLLVFLFPVVSISDDLMADRDALEETLALVVTAVILAIALLAVARTESMRLRGATFLLVHAATRARLQCSEARFPLAVRAPVRSVAASLRVGTPWPTSGLRGCRHSTAGRL
jgi:hypothetical protein